MEESTAESFNQTNEPSLNRLPTRAPEKSNRPVNYRNSRIPSAVPTFQDKNNYHYVPTTAPINYNKPRAPVPTFQDKENDYHYVPTARPIENARFHSAIPPRRYSSNGLHDINLNVRRPLQNFNRPMTRQFDDDVFYPPSISSVRTATPMPDFSKPDGRSSREIKHDLEKIYHRVQENERRSQMGFYPTARPTSHRASSTVPTSYQPNYPITKPTVRRSSSIDPVETRISSIAKPTARRSSSIDPVETRIPSISKPTARRSSSIDPVASHKNGRQVNFDIPIKPSSQSSVVPKIDRISRASNFNSQSQIDKDKKGLIDDIDLNYPHLLTLLKPVVLKTSNELPRNILNALRKRHELLVSGLKRAQTSKVLATEERHRRLVSEMREKKDEQLACLSLIEQITSRFFPNGTDRPGNVGAVIDQIRYIRKIFSLNWALSH